MNSYSHLCRRHLNIDLPLLVNYLDLIQSWTDKCIMCFNPCKCQFIQVSNIIHLMHSIYHLQWSYSMCPSIWSCHWSRCNYRPAPLLEPTHSQYLKQSQLNSIRGFLRWNISSCPGMQFQSRKHVYNIMSMIRSILEYATHVWSPWLTTIFLNYEWSKEEL